MPDTLPVTHLLDHVTDAVGVLDRAFHVRYVNRRASAQLRALGVDPAAALGRSLWALLPGLAGTVFEQTIRDAAESGAVARCEAVFEPLQRFVHVRVVPDSGHLLVVMADRTGERDARLELEDALERLELAIGGTADGVWSWNIATGTTWTSPRMAEMLGYTDGDALPASDRYIELVHPDDRERLRAALRDHFNDYRPFRAEYRIRHCDGRWRWHLSRGTSVRDASGKPVRMAGTTSDVTEWREAEAALNDSQTRFRVLASHSPVGIALWSRDGRAIYANPRLLEIYEVTIDEMLRGVMSDRIHPEEREAVQADWQRAVASIREYEATHRLVVPSGAERWVRVRTVPVRSDDRKTAGHVGIVEDITAWREGESLRRALEAQVQHAQKLESLGVLAGGIAHDFNNLLVGILGNANLALLDLPPESPVRATVQQILVAAERSAELTRQMLAYAGKGQFIVKRVNLSSLVHEMPSLLQTVISRRAQLVEQCDPVLPDVDGDPSQLTQVVMNLLTNASDALSEETGTVTVRTRVEHLGRDQLNKLYLGAELPPGPYVCLEVSDTGCGMNEDTLSRIFEPFFTTKFTGRGLGLAAVLGIVRGHRGALGVESMPGEGTQFRVYLPVAGSQAAAASAPPQESAAPPPSGLVLVVDDEASVRAVMRRFLERWGYEVIEAVDGIEALEIAERNRHLLSLVLLDLTMPKKDGIETFRELRQANRDVPVVLMSGFSEQAATAELGAHGLSGFIQKPFKGEHLRRVVAEAMSG